MAFATEREKVAEYCDWVPSEKVNKAVTFADVPGVKITALLCV